MQLSESICRKLRPTFGTEKMLERNGQWVTLPSVPRQCCLWEARMGLKQGDDGHDDGMSSLLGLLSNPT